MADLVRFHDWIFDRNELVLAKIEQIDGEPEDEFDKKRHAVICELKNEKKFTLVCRNLYAAKQELDLLTANINPISLEKEHNYYMVKQMYCIREYISGLTNEINKMMKSYSRLKAKEKKSEK